MRVGRRLKLTVLALTGFLLISTAAVIHHPAGRWRIAVLQLKIEGRLPHLPWSQVLTELKGEKGTWFGKTRIFRGVRGLVSGRVTLDRVTSVDDSCAALWNTPTGPLWGQATDGPLLEHLFHEQLVGAIYQNNLVSVSSGDVVLDVGSHLGTFTRSALESGARLVVAFEPEPGILRCFRRSFAEEIRTRRVILIEAAAWDSLGTVSFERPPSINTGMGTVSEAGQLTVETVTIDSIVEQLELETVDFIKMDIEGGERRALTGAAKSLSRFRPQLALSVYHKPDDPKVISRFVLGVDPEYEYVRMGGFAYFR